MTYDTIGRGYAARRRADPRIAAQINAALGDARRVLNVGAGAGSYEPVDRHVVAVEPSEVMIAQRASDAPPVVRAVAEQLPFPSGSFDAVLGVLTVHHWSDLGAGLAEMCRVAPRRVVLTFDETHATAYWLVADYFPEIAAVESARAPQLEEVAGGLGATRVDVVPVPHDCTDGFAGAYWRRPEAYFDPTVRRGMSSLAVLPDDVLEPALARLRADLDSGEWHERHAHLLALDEIDLGYRLVVSG
ncbi:MAG TPA: class I SAM-dependent methyltransferase [Acidimicrobiia bacterium]